MNWKAIKIQLNGTWMLIQDMIEEFNKDRNTEINQTEFLEMKSSLGRINNVVENLSNTTVWVKERMSGLKDKTDELEQSNKTTGLISHFKVRRDKKVASYWWKG